MSCFDRRITYLTLAAIAHQLELQMVMSNDKALRVYAPSSLLSSSAPFALRPSLRGL